MAYGSGIPARNCRLRSEFGADRHSTLSLPTLHFALYRGVPGSGGVEPDNTGNYGREAIANDGTLWGTILSTAVSITNAIDITWPVSTAAYSITDPLNHWAIHDAASGGVRWYWGELTTPIVVDASGDVPRIVAGALTITAPE